MKTTVHFYGQLTDITQTPVLELEGIADTDSMIKDLLEKFPGLSQAKFSIAVDNSLVQNNTRLKDNTIIALMPPFSGG
ncbi:MoaD/ThiS family protein [Ferruginibacter sp. HRS2-29]|uniref:MoaD/ThiS family protein n=1 Tax=Ferruginibacter sp. HRS2-29 TaxID=2487334 RepID=UPI0020CEC07E|nr:MoaD/ThiS family protein [Ferruginibacter sp. HRS2-29]